MAHVQVHQQYCVTLTSLISQTDFETGFQRGAASQVTLDGASEENKLKHL